MNARHEEPTADPRQRLLHAVEHLDHVLPGQAPILNFVHHNTLHGFQHLPFEQALAEAEKTTGSRAYQSEEDFRRYHAQGRIDDGDLQAALAARPGLRAEEALARAGDKALLRRDVLRIALLYGAEPLGAAQLSWQLEQAGALNRWQPDLPEAARQRLARRAAELDQTPAQAVEALWRACLETLHLGQASLHPEELTDLSAEQAEALLQSNPGDNGGTHRLMREHAQAALEQALGEIGAKNTLRGLLFSLTGDDVLERVRPLLIRYLGAYLDEGLAAWRLPGRQQGFYQAWRRLAEHDAVGLLADLPGWREQLAALPEDPLDAVIALMRGRGIEEAHWPGYLERLALQIPGWSGMVNWRQQRPNYPANREAPVALLDYLAVRLFLDGHWLTRLCRETWHIDATLDALRRYFSANLSEFWVRTSLQRNQLPEYLAAEAQRLIGQAHSKRSDRHAWRDLADQIWTWQHSPDAERPGLASRHGDAWRLFRLAQHLEFDAAALCQLGRDGAGALLATLDELAPDERGMVWLAAYERHYREAVFSAIVQNRDRGPWAQRGTRPEAQFIFCMDDREESSRRHLEELNPAVETLGAAGFFGVPINWKGLDDEEVTPLCPIVVTPAHEVREIPQPGCDEEKRRHDRRRGWKAGLAKFFHQELRRNLFSSALATLGLGPLLLPALAGKALLPRHSGVLAQKAQRWLEPAVPTRLLLTAIGAAVPATPDNPRLGFTDQEQADRVAGFLRTVGLTHGFAKLVVLAGHGSLSQNNPHLAAYDCGACSGRHGGPNARVFAAMANRPEVRRILDERGIAIPSDTWFIGSEHNTANEDILWFDLDMMPPAFGPALDKLKAELEQARRLSAHERCRRLASAPRKPTLKQALNHIIGRSTDFSQVRPELGHATNATAFIGRRSLSRGTFFDRRAFLISYDPTQDPEGAILENILLAAGPVGAGINLEYYFSTVNNDRFGCGSKVPHNVTGLFAVMEGGAGDLRTGLPKQMVEIHEAMRLLVVTEHKPDVLAAIYGRQPPLRELIGNAWLQVATVDPDTGVIWQFDPSSESFVQWQGPVQPLAKVKLSGEWYEGHTEPLPPALIERSAVGGIHG